jgi:protein gp37
MPGKTAIEWTDCSWNPVTGCTKVSAGCDHCYAEAFAERFRGVPGHPYEQGFDLKLWPERLSAPLRWATPRRVFVNSMSDLWHAHIPEAFIEQVFAVMAATPHHTYQILTKRPLRMRHTLSSESFATAVRVQSARVQRPGRKGAAPPAWPGWPLPNVWLGVSVENQDVDWRISWLTRTPAAIRFLSCEPLLGPLDLSRWLWEPAGPPWAGRNPSSDLGWVIAGGESGAGYRAVDPAWVRDLRDQCVAAHVPFFFKQFGGRTPRAGGRVLDGREWNQLPDGGGGFIEESADARAGFVVR